MKLRIRLAGRTSRIVLDDNPDRPPTLGVLTTAVAQEFQLEIFSLSLNGKDALEGDETILTSHGIVDGDLLHVLTSETGGNPDPQGAAPSPSHVSRTVQGLPSACNAQPQSLPPHYPAGGISLDKESASCESLENNTSARMEPQPGPSRQDEPDLPPDDEAIRDGEVNRYLAEPMLVQDSTEKALPQALQTVYNQASVRSNSDAISVVLHVLMAETGFSLHSGESSASDSSRRTHLPHLPKDWNSAAPYRLSYVHPASPGVTFTLVGVTLGPLLMVHGTAEEVDIGQKCQVKIKPTDFIKTLEPDASETLKNLPKLSRLFKDGIAHPLLQLTREALELPSIHGLMGLFNEIKLQILSHLDVKSLCRVTQVCSQLQDLAAESKLWRRLYLRDFGRRTNNDLSQNWLKLYKEKYLLRKELREQMRNARFVVPPFIDRPHPPFPFVPVYPPGFVGGDYDRDPSFQGTPGLYGPGPVPGPILPRPRFDPIGPLPPHRFPPGRGGGIWEGSSSGRGRLPRPPHPFGGGGGFGGLF